MGFWEIILILIIAIIVLGPKQLPKLAVTLGKLYRQFQNLSGHLRKDFEDELKQDQLKKNMEKARMAEQKQQAQNTISDPANDKN